MANRSYPSWLTILGLATIPMWIFAGFYALITEPWWVALTISAALMGYGFGIRAGLSVKGN